MDIDIDTWSGGIPGGIPKTTIEHTELARTKRLSIKTGYQISTRTYRDKDRKDYHTGTKLWSPVYTDSNRDPDIEEELDFPNADTLEESLRLMEFPGPALFRVNETEVSYISN
jgi:hypothetical protein